MSEKAMHTTEEKRKAILETLGRVQLAHPEYFQHCPRCGSYKMREDMLHNALSRRAKVYICNICGMIEAIQDSRGDSRTTEDWSVFKEIEVRQDQGDLNVFSLSLEVNYKGHHCICGHVSVTMDSQDKLGIESAEDDLRVGYDLEDHELVVSWLQIDCDEEYSYDLEQKPGLATAIIASMEMGCFEEYGMSMQELLVSYWESGD